MFTQKSVTITSIWKLIMYKTASSCNMQVYCLPSALTVGLQSPRTHRPCHQCNFCKCKRPTTAPRAVPHGAPAQMTSARPLRTSSAIMKCSEQHIMLTLLLTGELRPQAVFPKVHPKLIKSDLKNICIFGLQRPYKGNTGVSKTTMLHVWIQRYDMPSAHQLRASIAFQDRSHALLQAETAYPCLILTGNDTLCNTTMASLQTWNARAPGGGGGNPAMLTCGT